MRMERKTILLSKDDFRQFTVNAQVLHEQGYDLPHEVKFLEDDKFEVTVLGDHDWDALDELMEKAQNNV